MIRIEKKYFSIRLNHLPWDSKVLGTKCGFIEISKKFNSGLRKDNLSEFLKLLLSKAKNQQYRFLTSKISAEEQNVANACFSNGGILIDTELTFEKSLRERSSVSETLNNNISIKKFTKYWDRSIFKIADSFTFSRFLKDSNIERAKAIMLWRNSIYNNCNGRASYSIICFMNKKPVGVMNIFEKGCTSEIFLIGVTNVYQSRGLGRAMMRFYEENLDKDIKRQIVETSLLNYKAQNLYLWAGYKNYTSKYIIHFWL